LMAFSVTPSQFVITSRTSAAGLVIPYERAFARHAAGLIIDALDRHINLPGLRAVSLRSQVASKWRPSPFRYPKSNGFARATPICPASCSRLARNAGDFWRLIAFGFGTGADLSNNILLRNKSTGRLSTEKEILP
jgi:hypothetical protein